MEIRSEEADSVACDPMFVGVVRLELVDVLEWVMKLEVGSKENETSIGSYDKTPVADDETVVEMLVVVGMLNENCGQSLVVEDAGSEADVEIVVDAEEDDSCVVEGVDDDVSKEEDTVETVLDNWVDVGWFPAGAPDTFESPPLAAIAASSPWVCRRCMM
jgi:hypothetical protein